MHNLHRRATKEGFETVELSGMRLFDELYSKRSVEAGAKNEKRHIASDGGDSRESTRIEDARRPKELRYIHLLIHIIQQRSAG